jgi:hypothetical protein
VLLPVRLSARHHYVRVSYEITVDKRVSYSPLHLSALEHPYL